MAKLTKSLLINKISASISKFFSKSNMKDIAEKGAELIKSRTRSGKGVDVSGGEERALKPLARSTVERRRRKNLHPSTSPGKSNLTESGKMLDSIQGTVDSANNPRIEIAGAKNRKKASEVQGDRPFLNLSKKEIDTLKDEIKKKLIAEIRRGL